MLMKKLTLFFLLAMSVSCVMAQQNPTNAQEQYQLGLKYLNEQNQERALFWMEKAAHQGLAEAQVHFHLVKKQIKKQRLLLSGIKRLLNKIMPWV